MNLNRLVWWNAERHRRANLDYRKCQCGCYGCRFDCGAHWIWFDRIKWWR